MIRDLMGSLNLVDETISAITFNFTTRFTATKKPIDRLSKLIKLDFLRKMKKDPLLITLNVLSIRLGDIFPIEKQGFNIAIEPLLSNPEKMFFIQFMKKLINRDSLFELVNEFPKTLENPISGVDSND